MAATTSVNNSPSHAVIAATKTSCATVAASTAKAAPAATAPMAKKAAHRLKL
ncbi:MAG: hypothetical protein K2W93_14320 [Burkholderiaceae bacterium]|nr:hypothetical protein [Burkholderiaceae bacterium]